MIHRYNDCYGFVSRRHIKLTFCKGGLYAVNLAHIKISKGDIKVITNDVETAFLIN